ncbi:hypothetical protein F4804DRAFT_347024 [Jackrogersella minutella]|nr:hypothetical protein F4804DRAFT_347024 [Jackrogersella minutella]
MDSVHWLNPPFRFITPAEVLSAGIILPLLCITLVGIRFYIRCHYGTRVGIDDWLIALGVLAITGIGVSMIANERLGVMGYPIPIPPATTRSDAYVIFLASHMPEEKIEFSMQILMAFAYGCVRNSLIVFSRRIFASHNHSVFNWVSWILIFLSTSWSLSFLVALVFGCGKNAPFYWPTKQSEKNVSCTVFVLEEGLVISGFILDVFILILPIPTIWTLNMSCRKKLATTGVFLVGLLSITTAITRMLIYFLVSYQLQGDGYDLNQTAATLLYLSMLEISLAAIAACLPSLNVLAKHVSFRKFYSRLGSGMNPAGLLPPWKSSPKESRWPRPSADSAENNSRDFASMETNIQGKQTNRQYILRRDEVVV